MSSPSICYAPLWLSILEMQPHLKLCLVLRQQLQVRKITGTSFIIEDQLFANVDV